MALIQSQAKAPGTGGRAQFVGMALTVAVLIVAAAMVAVLASSLTAKSTGGSIVTTKADPLVQQGAIQFRAAEHAAGAAAGRPAHSSRARSSSAPPSAPRAPRLVDPLLQTNAIQFRADEHAAAVDRAHRSPQHGEHPAGMLLKRSPEARLAHDQPAWEVVTGDVRPSSTRRWAGRLAGPSCCPGMRRRRVDSSAVPTPRVSLHHLDHRMAGRLPVRQVAEDVGRPDPSA